MNSDIKTTTKRYRYTGKERDEESGLYYHAVRYYAPWLARWTACDPAGLEDGINIYVFVGNRPLFLADPSGTQAKTASFTPSSKVENSLHLNDDPDYNQGLELDRVSWQPQGIESNRKIHFLFGDEGTRAEEVMQLERSAMYSEWDASKSIIFSPTTCKSLEHGLNAVGHAI